jgi:hypothetical protein
VLDIDDATTPPVLQLDGSYASTANTDPYNDQIFDPNALDVAVIYSCPLSKSIQVTPLVYRASRCSSQPIQQTRTYANNTQNCKFISFLNLSNQKMCNSVVYAIQSTKQLYYGIVIREILPTPIISSEICKTFLYGPNPVIIDGTLIYTQTLACKTYPPLFPSTPLFEKSACNNSITAVDRDVIPLLVANDQIMAWYPTPYVSYVAEVFQHIWFGTLASLRSFRLIYIGCRIYPSSMIPSSALSRCSQFMGVNAVFNYIVIPKCISGMQINYSVTKLVCNNGWPTVGAGLLPDIIYGRINNQIMLRPKINTDFTFTGRISG